jgi:hypothetical protein
VRHSIACLPGCAGQRKSPRHPACSATHRAGPAAIARRLSRRRPDRRVIELCAQCRLTVRLSCCRLRSRRPARGHRYVIGSCEGSGWKVPAMPSAPEGRRDQQLSIATRLLCAWARDPSTRAAELLANFLNESRVGAPDLTGAQAGSEIERLLHLPSFQKQQIPNQCLVPCGAQGAAHCLGLRYVP